ncbi:acyl-CoA thioesterase [Minwuia thermotolerans]|uniref:Thioesterase n=1 Tax=Minwuia thermotolerans TaxID=2056226 RepID=A0A2M9G4Y2_9PROT|nr:thioesterase family protein [Minwuia thermotolerans]PJK30773.1 hypothetical protein CVT23_05235 [Minwuia thermotolerans]
MSGDAVYWRGVFNQWQRGLGGHVNIQHYANAIEEARRAHAFELGHDPIEMRAKGLAVRPLKERIDFRRELAPGDAAFIEGAGGLDIDGETTLAGRMLRPHDDAPVMRFETSWAIHDVDRRVSVDGTTPDLPPVEAEARLRPIPEPWTPAHPPEHALLAWRGTVEVRDCDEHELQSPRAIFDIVTRALWAVQVPLGGHRREMGQRGAAGAMTAVQVRHGRPARMGDLLSVRVATLGFGETSVRFGQIIADETDGEIVARVEYVMSFFDRASGRRSPPDAAAMEGFRALLAL